jgi:hypothetical protein
MPLLLLALLSPLVQAERRMRRQTLTLRYNVKSSWKSTRAEALMVGSSSSEAVLLAYHPIATPAAIASVPYVYAAASSPNRCTDAPSTAGPRNAPTLCDMNASCQPEQANVLATSLNPKP